GLVPLYLASVTPLEDLNVVLERRGMKKYFKQVFGDPPVPKRESVVRVKALENCRNDELVLVGDSEGDWKTAKETGIGFIGYRSGMPVPREATVFSNWTKLAEHLRSLLAAVS